MNAGVTSRRGLCVLGSAATLMVLLVLVARWAPTSAAAAGFRSNHRATTVDHRCHGQRRVLCGVVRVPLYWSHRNGRHLSVHFRVYLHTDRSAPAGDPIVAMEGGPGYASIESAAAYRFMIGALHRRHDLIVMDNRGTGTSDAIDCPGLQRYDGLAGPHGIAVAVRDCARRLGSAANAFGSAAVGDDLADILHRLGVHKVDIYGDSYGDYSAQVFTYNHPGLVRAMVLDGSYDNGYNPFEPEASAALRRAWTVLCRRSDGCRGQSILTEIGAFDRRLEHHALRGFSRDAYGDRVRVDLTAPAFVQLVSDATYYYSTFIDLPAALRAFAAATIGR
jgi:pimeloyl-ACP methyl ester carboxylesterase